MLGAGRRSSGNFNVNVSMKKKEKKTKKLVYETDLLYRWNLCQQLAKRVYRSQMTEYQIQEELDSIEITINECSK